MENIESRVTDLEIQVTHQMRTIEELNTVIISQQKRLEEIEKTNSVLLQAVRNYIVDDNQIPTDYMDQKPPHY